MEQEELVWIYHSFLKERPGPARWSRYTVLEKLNRRDEEHSSRKIRRIQGRTQVHLQMERQDSLGHKDLR